MILMVFKRFVGGSDHEDGGIDVVKCCGVGAM